MDSDQDLSAEPSSEAPDAEAASATVVDDRQAELVAKGVLFEKIEKLPAGSVVAFMPSSEVIDRIDVRIMVRSAGVHPTYLHGPGLAVAAEQL